LCSARHPDPGPSESLAMGRSAGKHRRPTDDRFVRWRRSSPACASPGIRAPAPTRPDACSRVEARAEPHPAGTEIAATARTIPRARALRRKAGVRISARRVVRRSCLRPNASGPRARQSPVPRRARRYAESFSCICAERLGHSGAGASTAELGSSVRGDCNVAHMERSRASSRGADECNRSR
jgi:hypothetical protein